jgi:Co/Zn/Cd efflux system component
MINEIIKRTETLIETRRLKIVVVILTIYLAVEIVAGYITGSLALIADALYMFADVFGISLVLVASIFSKNLQLLYIPTDSIDLKFCPLLPIVLSCC